MRLPHAAVLAAILIWAWAGAADARNPYVECVQNQLTAAGYDPGPVDGLMGRQTRAAWSELAKTLPDSERITLLPRLNTASAIHWCREIGQHKPELRRFMPSRLGPILAFEADDPRFLITPVIDEIEGFFRSVYDIEIAGQIGMVLGKTPKSIAQKIYGMSDDLPLRLRGVETLARTRCSDERIAGLAYPDRMYICAPWMGRDAKFIEGWKRKVTQAVLVHEFTHLVQSELAGWRSNPYRPKGSRVPLGPGWLAEGGAEFVSRRYENFLRKINHVIIFPPSTRDEAGTTTLRQMRDPQKVKTTEDYATSLYAVFLLTERVGEEAMFRYWRLIGSGKSWESAFRDSFGLDLADFEIQFETLRKDPGAAKQFAAGQ